MESIDAPQDHPLDYANIYAQAYALYRQGFQFWFSKAEILKLSEHNRQFETVHEEKELVSIYFRRPGEFEPGEYMPVTRAKQIVGGNMVNSISTVRLGLAFKELGFELKHTKTGNRYRVVQRSAQEIQSLLRTIPDDG